MERDFTGPITKKIFSEAFSKWSTAQNGRALH